MPHHMETSNNIAHQMQDKIDSLMTELRDHIDNLDDPQAEALFETSAEVLGGLAKAFEHYRKSAEEAWED